MRVKNNYIFPAGSRATLPSGEEVPVSEITYEYDTFEHSINGVPQLLGGPGPFLITIKGEKQ